MWFQGYIMVTLHYLLRYNAYLQSRLNLQLCFRASILKLLLCRDFHIVLWGVIACINPELACKHSPECVFVALSHAASMLAAYVKSRLKYVSDC